MKKCETLFDDFWRAYLMSCVQNANPIVTNFKFINFPHPVIADADNHLWFSGMRRHGHDGYHATRWSPSCSMLLIGTIMLNSTRWVRVDFQNSCHGACPSNTHHPKLMPCHMPTNHSYDRCQKKLWILLLNRVEKVQCQVFKFWRANVCARGLM